MIISIITILISGIITFIFHKDILEFLLNPTNGLTYFQNTKPIYTELTEYISVAIKVSIYTGILISSPIIFLQIISFLSPGLKKNEKSDVVISGLRYIGHDWLAFLTNNNTPSATEPLRVLIDDVSQYQLGDRVDLIANQTGVFLFK